MASLTLSPAVLKEFQDTLTALAKEASLQIEVVGIKGEEVALKFQVTGVNNTPLTHLTKVLQVGDTLTLCDLTQFVNICVDA